MTNVTMKAIDTLHVSSVSPHNLQPGEEFEVSKHIADDLEKRGLAKVVDADGGKAAPAPANKAEKPLANKKA